MQANVVVPAGVGIRSIAMSRPRDEVSVITVGFYGKEGLPVTDGAIEPGRDPVTYTVKNPVEFQARNTDFIVWVDGQTRWGQKTFPMGEVKLHYFPTHATVEFATNAGEPYDTIVDIAFEGSVTAGMVPHLTT